MEETENIKKIEQEPKKKSLVKRLLKILFYTVLFIIGLNIFIYILFSIPYIQQKAANFAVNELKKTLDTEIAIDELRLSLFNHVTLKGIYIEDQAKDTLLYAKNLDVSLSPWRLIKNGELSITEITLDNFLININQKDSISDLNFQFIIDAFSSEDTIKADTTKRSLAIVIKDVNLTNGRLNYNILSDTLTPGIFNASHISLYDFTANLDLNSIDPDNLDIFLNRLSSKEASGIEVKNLKGHLFSKGSLLWVEDLSLNLPESHLTTNKVKYNLSSGEFEIGTDDTEISPKDLIAFLPNLKFLNNSLSLKTEVKGALPAINIDAINITYGEDFILQGKAFINNYERYANSDIGVFINKFKVSPSAITSFARLGDSTFVSPDILKDLGDLFLKGQLTGQLSKFKLEAESWNNQGSLNLHAIGGVDSTFTDFDITAGLKTHNYNLGKLLGADSGLGKISAYVNLKAEQNNKLPLTAQARGKIETLDFQKDTLKDLPFDAYYNSKEMGLSAKADWKIGKISVDASMSQAQVPDINVQLKVDTLHIDHFYKNEEWINPRLSLTMNGKIKGLDIDKMAGFVYIDSLDFHDENISFKPGKFSLEAGTNEQNSKYIDLNSSLLSANITGQYTFTTLADELSILMHNYLPNVFPQPNRYILTRKKGNDFTFKITAKNTEKLGRILDLPVDVILPATIDGHISTIDNLIKIDGDIPHIRFGEYDIQNFVINAINVDSAFSITAKNRILMEEGDYNMALNVDGADNSIHTSIGISSDNTNININGKLEARAEFSRNENKELVSLLKVFPSDILVGKLALNMLPAEVLNAGTRTEIHNLGLGVNKKKYFGVDGVISNQKTDSLKAYFSHAEIGDLLEAFDIKNIRGCIHGNVLLTNLLDQPEVYTQGLEMADIVIFSDTLGTLNLESAWSDEFGGAKLDVSLMKKEKQLAEIDGVIYTRQDSLDLQLRLMEMPLRWMQPFFSDMLNTLDGSISTNLMVEGSSKAPKTRGFLGFNDTQIGIDYTNVTYTISDTIMVNPDRIGFDNLTLKDSRGNTAKVNATLTHKNFKDMKYSLNMQMDKLMVLNTEHRTDSLFYGRVFASGAVKIDGDDKGINVNMQIKNDKNSTLNILLPQHSEASDYKSVVYINVPEEKIKDSAAGTGSSPANDAIPLKLNVKLDVTPDVTFGVVIDPATGDEMKAKGHGTITFNYDMQTENMSAYGDYTLNEGYVKLNLQNIKKLQFEIKEGSKLYFSGDPMKTRFDITAYRRVRADLKSLDTSFDNDNYPSRVDVDCILDIKGNINKMDVGYNIGLPNAEDDVRTRVNSYISTDEQKTLQFASLVATGSFYSSMGSTGSNFGNSLWTGLASSTLSNGLSALVGNMLGDKWQVGANIESNDGSFSDVNMTVNVSRKFMDDKLQIKTNFGYHADQSTTADNSFIGDFDAEYQLNSVWTLRAYNHTNDRFYKQAPYTQGIGITYSKEAATLRRLFQSFKPRRYRDRQRQQETPVQPSDSTQTNIEKQPVTTTDNKEKE